ncbi:MAG: DUF4492 domain-containing protein [Bacteroidota bacterium]
MSLLKRLFSFYYQGFREMTLGKNLWIIILIKLSVMFLVLKLLFFPDFLGSKFNNDKDRSDYIIHEITKIKK